MKIKKSELNPPETDFMENNHTASQTECTGLMQNIPRDEAELESYQDLYQMEVPNKQQDELADLQE